VSLGSARGSDQEMGSSAVPSARPAEVETFKRGWVAVHQHTHYGPSAHDYNDSVSRPKSREERPRSGPIFSISVAIQPLELRFLVVPPFHVHEEAQAEEHEDVHRQEDKARPDEEEREIDRVSHVPKRSTLEQGALLRELAIDIPAREVRARREKNQPTEQQDRAEQLEQGGLGKWEGPRGYVKEKSNEEKSIESEDCRYDHR